MKKLLKRIEKKCYWIDEKAGESHDGVHDRIRGDVSGLWGNVSDIWGDVSGLWGNVSDIWGNVSYISGDMSDISGNVSGIRGNVSECELSDEDRQKGINISDLVI